MGTLSPKPPPPGRTLMVPPPLAGSVKCYGLVHTVRTEPPTSLCLSHLLVVDCMFAVPRSPCRLTMGTPSPKPPPPGRTSMVPPPLAGSVKCYVLVHREMVVRKEPHTSLLVMSLLYFSVILVVDCMLAVLGFSCKLTTTCSHHLQ